MSAAGGVLSPPELPTDPLTGSTRSRGEEVGVDVVAAGARDSLGDHGPWAHDSLGAHAPTCSSPLLDF